MKRLMTEMMKKVHKANLLSLVTTGLANANFAIRLNTQAEISQPHLIYSDIDPANNWSHFDVSLILVSQNTSLLRAGSHLISPRTFYIHHGVYLGEGKVAHYSGLSSALRSGPIEVTDLAGFANGRSVWISEDKSSFSNEEIVRRACSRIGESKYSILSNNCEHFCNWCIKGTSYSSQAYDFIHSPARFFTSILGSIPSVMA